VSVSPAPRSVAPRGPREWAAGAEAPAARGEADARGDARDRGRAAIVAALGTLYFVWGSTYLAIALALEGFPPFLMGGLRFLAAGAVLYGFLRLRGVPAATGRQWAGSSVVGLLLLLGGNGGVAFAEQTVASGVAAVVIATTPILTAFFAGLVANRWPARIEWVGLVLGLGGVALLNLGGDLRVHPVGMTALLAAATCWSFGSVVSGRLGQAPGMMATAAQLLTGGAWLMLASVLLGERMPGPPEPRALAAFVYLVVVGSLVGYSTYVYLLGRVRPSLATSYAYVNPIVAVALGFLFAGEPVTATMVLSMAVILGGVALVAVAKERKRA
jgi:drug/metabolite transporter (DMT)-like permease